MSNLPQHSSASPQLLILPFELQNSIISYLAIPEILALRLTCTHFHTTITPPTHEQLLLAEQTSWARSRNLYVCKDCLRLRTGTKFADSMKKGRKGLNGGQRHKRFCVDCGVKPKRGETRYSPGTEIVIEGVRKVFCVHCRRWKSGNEAGSPGSQECQRCHKEGKIVESVARFDQRGGSSMRWDLGYDYDYDHGSSYGYDSDLLEDGYYEDMWE